MHGITEPSVPVCFGCGQSCISSRGARASGRLEGCGRFDVAGLSRGAGLSRSAADGDAVHPHTRLANTHRHALAVLAAGTDPVVEPQIVADHGDLGHRVGAVADEGGALDRRADFAVLDEVGLGGGEYELARGYVDAAAAE